jgi:peptide/nickel transport system substrate-binding protein
MEETMRSKWLLLLFAVVLATILAACAAPEAEIVEVTKEVVVTQIVVEEGEEKIVEVTKIVKEEVIVEVTAVPEEAAAPTEPQAGGTLNLSLGPDFVTYDPFYDVTNMEFKVPFFEAPLRISDEGGFEPWLAESFEVNEDGTVITLHLRQGIMFHNGREMTAEDVVWTVDRARDQEQGYHLADRFTTCIGAAAIDDYTVEVYYSETTHSAPDGLARMYIFPQEAAETIETVPVGTGPFKFEEWVPGDHMTAVRFEDYWREGFPYIDKLVVRPMPDPQSRMVNLLAGSIDLLNGVPLADKELLESAPGITVGQSPPGFSFYAFLMNINEPPFDNVLVRQAMNYAVDREKINQLAFSGQALTSVLPYAETSWAYPADLEGYYTYDPDKARELLAEAGYPDGFKTEMLVRDTSGVYLDYAQVYQQDLAAIGVEIELLPTELPQYWPKLIGSEFSIVSHGTGDATVDASGLFEGAACCRPFRNFFGITEDTTWFPEYADLIAQAGNEMDQEVRKDLYRQALEILMEQGWTINVAWRQQVYAHSDKLQGLRTDMDGQIWLDEAWLVQ